MLACNNADRILSEKMGVDDQLKTMECLRGRLLAERAASKIANHDLELMSNKLAELENQLKAEIKSKKIAEKKLKFLQKKLEPLKIKNVVDNSEPLNSLNNFKPEFTDSVKCSIEEANENHSPQIEENSNQNHESFEKIQKPESSLKDEESTNENHSLKSSMEVSGGNECIEDDESVDNSLALILVPPTSQGPSQKEAELKMINKNVGEVLDALRLAREKLQRSMERRHEENSFGLIATSIC